MSEDINQNTSDDNTEITDGESEESEDLTDEIECIEEDTWVLIEDPLCAGDSEEFAQLLCQLKSMCIETVADFSYNPVSVNVWTKRRSIQITIDVCTNMDNEAECRNEASYEMDTAEVKSTTEEQQITNDIPDDDDVWRSVSLTSPINTWNLGFELGNRDPLHGWTHCMKQFTNELT